MAKFLTGVRTEIVVSSNLIAVHLFNTRIAENFVVTFTISSY